MKRTRQKCEDIIASLSRIEVSWMDGHAVKAIEMLRSIPAKKQYTEEDIMHLLDADFQIGFTVIRLFMDQAKDEFVPNLRAAFANDGIGKGVEVKRYRADKASYLEVLIKLGLTAKMTEVVNRPLHWSDQLIERLKGGRGSATKGQKRGRDMEDFVESILTSVFTKEQIAARCRFTGAKGLSTEKADFAVPSAKDPHILIEVKAYGATGSKQTDVLGDVSRIVEEKRNDTVFFLVTDGITWKERQNDLKKLIALQNQGQIQKIYTKSMAAQLKADLESLKHSYGL